MLRTFIAIRIEPRQEMSECLEHLQQSLQGEKIKWVDPGKMHITLRFLGDTDPVQVRATGRILEDTVPGYACPEVEFGGLGLFRNLRDPRVLWIGMDPGPVLPELKGSLDRKLADIGFLPEDREFRPHLTLGRIKFLRERDNLKELLEYYSDTVFQKNRIGEVIHYESILRPEGPEYKSLKTVPFKNA